MRGIRTRIWCRLGSALLGTVVLSGCGTPSVTPVATHSEVAVVNSEAVQSLQRQVKERDKRIAELRSKLRS